MTCLLLPSPHPTALGGHNRLARPPSPARAICARWADVTMYEAFHKPGGVLVYGIPSSVCPRRSWPQEMKTLKAMGVNIVTDAIVGKSMSVDELFDDFGYEAVYIGSGAGLPQFLAHPRREPAGRLFRQRIPHPREPDEGLPRRLRYTHQALQPRGGRGRRQRGHGRLPRGETPGARSMCT